MTAPSKSFFLPWDRKSVGRRKDVEVIVVKFVRVFEIYVFFFYRQFLAHAVTTLPRLLAPQRDVHETKNAERARSRRRTVASARWMRSWHWPDEWNGSVKQKPASMKNANSFWPKRRGSTAVSLSCISTFSNRSATQTADPTTRTSTVYSSRLTEAFC